MGPDVLIGQGDFGFAVEHTCEDADGPVDLSDADSVVFTLAPIDGAPAVFEDKPAENRDDSNGSTGLVSYTWADGDTDVPGVHLGLFTVTWNGTNEDEPEEKRTFPASGPLIVRITSRLPAVAVEVP